MNGQEYPPRQQPQRNTSPFNQQMAQNGHYSQPSAQQGLPSQTGFPAQPYQQAGFPSQTGYPGQVPGQTRSPAQTGYPGQAPGQPSSPPRPGYPGQPGSSPSMGGTGWPQGQPSFPGQPGSSSPQQRGAFAENPASFPQGGVPSSPFGAAQSQPGYSQSPFAQRSPYSGPLSGQSSPSTPQPRSWPGAQPAQNNAFAPPAGTAWNAQSAPLHPPVTGNGQNRLSQPLAPTGAPAFVSPPEQGAGNHISKRTAVLVVLLVAMIIMGAVFGPTLFEKLSGKGTAQNDSSSSALVTPTTASVSLHDKYKLLAKQYVSKMSLDEKLGQLIMVQYAGRYYSDDLDYMINQQHVGGIIMYEDHRSTQQQLRTVDQAKTDIAKMQQRAKTSLLIGIDEEGGYVTRLYDIFPPSKSPDAMFQTGDPSVATSQGHQVAQEMQQLGINLNFAPDVDVSIQNSYLDNDNRTFGYTADDVIKYAGAYMHAQQSDGVIDCIKHFPGIGSVPKGFDPHTLLPTVSKTPQELDSADLVPFKHFIDAKDPNDQPGMIMPTDVLVPSLDPTYPAEFSHAIMTDLLRKKLGYDGAVISDSVIMGGVQVNGVKLDQAQASLLAIQAGVDMVLDVDSSTSVAAIISTLKDALQQGTLSQARVDEAATHIIALKMERKVISAQAS